MSDGFTVHPLDLRAHADALDQYQERISTARSAVDSDDLGAESFGILCQFFAMDARGHADTAKNTLDVLGDAAGQMAGGVRDTAALYNQVDEANRALLERVR